MPKWGTSKQGQEKATHIKICNTNKLSHRLLREPFLHNGLNLTDGKKSARQTLISQHCVSYLLSIILAISKKRYKKACFISYGNYRKRFRLRGPITPQFFFRDRRCIRKATLLGFFCHLQSPIVVFDCLAKPKICRPLKAFVRDR